MKIVVIGGTGHIGTYLVPRLVLAGYEVLVVSRGKRGPYSTHSAWNKVNQIHMDRIALERDGTFGEAIKSLRPDVVFDLVCFTLASARQLVDALRGHIQFFAHCGTIWVRGYGSEVPATEEHPRNPITDYGIQKNEVETFLLQEARINKFPATLIHPGHIVGPGWAPVGPTACHDLEGIQILLSGKQLALPNLGMETLHHVHADDVAQGFVQALSHWSSSIGESFFAVSQAALTMRGFAEGLAERFGVQANLQYLPFEDWLAEIPDEYRESAKSHVLHSSNASIAKAARMLEYNPRYSSLDAVEESVHWLINQGRIQL